jgi:hypothetical protein
LYLVDASSAGSAGLRHRRKIHESGRVRSLTSRRRQLHLTRVEREGVEQGALLPPPLLLAGAGAEQLEHRPPSHHLQHRTDIKCEIIWRCTDKKEKKIFLIYKEIQKGAFAKSYMTNGLLIYGEIFAHFLIYKPFLINDFATAPLWISLYMRKIWFSFLSVWEIAQKVTMTNCTSFIPPLLRYNWFFYNHIDLYQRPFKIPALGNKTTHETKQNCAS